MIRRKRWGVAHTMKRRRKRERMRRRRRLRVMRGINKKTTPLWKYVARLGGGRGGGTTKFTCLHCNKTYTGSYTSFKLILERICVGLRHVIKIRLLGSKPVTKCQLKKETNIGWKKRPLKTIPRDQGSNLNPHIEC